MKNSPAWTMLWWRKHSHVRYSLVILYYLPFFAIFITVENEKGNARFSQRFKNLHLKTIISHHNRFDLFANWLRLYSFKERMHEIGKRDVVELLLSMPFVVNDSIQVNCISFFDFFRFMIERNDSFA